MKDIQYGKDDVNTVHTPADELENLYNMYFTPVNLNTQPVMFEQVTLFDYTLVSYASDSVSPSKVSYV